MLACVVFAGGLVWTLSRDSCGAAVDQDAAHKSYVETIPGSRVQFDMIAIPEGTFTMGSRTRNKDGRPMKDPNIL